MILPEQCLDIDPDEAPSLIELRLFFLQIKRDSPLVCVDCADNQQPVVVKSRENDGMLCKQLSQTNPAASCEISPPPARENNHTLSVRLMFHLRTSSSRVPLRGSVARK